MLEKSYIAPGERGTDQTVQAMAQAVIDAQACEYVRQTAVRVLDQAGVAYTDQWAAAKALFDYVSDTIRYLPDPVDVEWLQDPPVTLREQAGDCDDIATLLAALARSVGIDSRFRVIGGDRDNFQHVYLELNIDGQWVPADPVEAAALGDRPPLMPAEKTYDNLKGLRMDTPQATLNRFQAMVLPEPERRRIAYQVTTRLIDQAWTDHLITAQDLRDTVQFLSMPAKAPDRPAAEAAIKAIQDYMRVAAPGTVADASTMAITGLYGMSGLFDSIWSGIKGAYNEIKGILFGDEPDQPTQVVVQQPQQSTVEKILPWVMIGLLGVVALKA